MQDVQQGQIKGYISAHHIDTLAYIIQKNTHSKNRTRYVLQSLCTGLHIIPIDGEVVKHALDDTSIGDIEDAILYHACVGYAIDTLITRNTKDFPSSNYTISIIDPTAYN